MRYAVFAVLACSLLSLNGCSTGALPSLSFNDSDGSASAFSSPPRASFNAPPPPVAPEPEVKRVQASSSSSSSSSSDSNVLSDIWDNFSSAFRSGSQQPATETKPATQTASLSGTPVKVQFDVQEALTLINRFRATKGLKPLKLDPRAEQAASLLTADMAKNDHMSHHGPNGADVAKRLTLSGYNYQMAAENVGVGQLSVKEMVEGWEKSPPHRKNMLLPDATHMGISMQYKPDTKYKTFWALVLAAPS